jgi:hypothetical protein
VHEFQTLLPDPETSVKLLIAGALVVWGLYRLIKAPVDFVIGEVHKAKLAKMETKILDSTPGLREQLGMSQNYNPDPENAAYYQDLISEKLKK